MQCGNIQWEPSPNIPAQNGIVERGMDTVIGPLRTILKEYTISIGLWDLFLEGVVYTLNRLISRSIAGGITPFEAVNGVPPNVSHLRALGCRAYNRQKNGRSRKGVFVGYNSENQWISP